MSQYFSLCYFNLFTKCFDSSINFLFINYISIIHNLEYDHLKGLLQDSEKKFFNFQLNITCEVLIIFFIYFFGGVTNMLGIGHRLERETKQKILAQKAKQYNTKYDQLLGTGLQPEQAAKTLTSEDFQRRHLERPEIEPYNISKKINHLGGTVNQGYFEAQSVLSTTKNMYQPIEQELKKVRQNKPDREALSQAKKEFERMKYRIYKDHLQEDAQIDFGEVKASDYKRNFVEDDKLKQEVRNRDKRYNQWQNDLKDYAEHYLKSKQCLRKC